MFPTKRGTPTDRGKSIDSKEGKTPQQELTDAEEDTSPGVSSDTQVLALFILPNATFWQ